MKSGISENNIEISCELIENFADKINNLLSQIENEIDLAKKNYEGDTSEEFFKKTRIISETKNTIINNIKSYSTELKELKRKYKMQDEIMSTKLSEGINKIN